MAIAIIGPKFYGFDPDTGKPLAGGKVYFYQAGTVDTPLDTYTDETGETANTNPVILNAAGYAGIYLKGVYKVVLTDADGNVIYTVEPVNSELQQVNEWIKDQPITVVDASRFTVPGNQTDLFEVGRAIRITNAGGDTYSYGFISDVSYATETTVTVELQGESVVNAGDISAAVGLLTKDSFGGFTAKDASEFGQLREDLKSTGGAGIVFTESGESVQEAITRLNELNNEALIEEHNEDTEAHPALTQFITQQIELANLAAEAAISVGNIYETIEAGIAATNQDDYFMVPTDNENIYATLYRNTSESGGTQRTAVFSPSPGDPATAVKTLAANAFGDEYTATYALQIPQDPGTAELRTVMVYFQGRRAGATWTTISSRTYVQRQGETSDFYPDQSITGDYPDAGENCEFRLVVEGTVISGYTLTAGQLEYQEGATAGGALEIKVYPSKTALDNALEQIEQAKEAALSSGLIYPDTATGLEATEDNAYFSVVSPEADEYTILYQKVGGLAIERKRLATSAFVNDVVTAAETAADVAMTAGWVYASAAAGEAARADGDYFWVVSGESAEVLELWLMGASAATDTGKRTTTSTYTTDAYTRIANDSSASILSYNPIALAGKTTPQSSLFSISEGSFSSGENALAVLSNSSANKWIDTLLEIPSERNDDLIVMVEAELVQNLDTASTFGIGIGTGVEGVDRNYAVYFSSSTVFFEGDNFSDISDKLSVSYTQGDKVSIGLIFASDNSVYAFTVKPDGTATAPINVPVGFVGSGKVYAYFRRYGDWRIRVKKLAIGADLATSKVEASQSIDFSGVARSEEQSLLSMYDNTWGDFSGDFVLSNKTPALGGDVALFSINVASMSSGAVFGASISSQLANQRKILLTATLKDIPNPAYLPSIGLAFGDSSFVKGASYRSNGQFFSVNASPTAGDLTPNLPLEVPENQIQFSVGDKLLLEYWIDSFDGSKYTIATRMSKSGSSTGLGYFTVDSIDEAAFLIRASSSWDLGVLSSAIDDIETTSENVLYVSPTGNDSNNGSKSSPFATINKAVSESANGGVVEIDGGEYRETVNVSKDLWIRSAFNKRVSILGSEQLSLTKTAGYTSVYQASLASKPVGMGAPRGEPVIFEWGTPSKLITEADRHDLHRGQTHRLPFTEMFEAASIAELDTPAGYGKWFWDNGTIYLSATDGSDATLKRYEARVRETLKQSGGSIKLTRIDTYFSTSNGMEFRNSLSIHREDCRTFGNHRNGFSDDCNYIHAVRDEAAACGNDGANGTAQGYTGTDNRTVIDMGTYIDPWYHDNYDDGISYHHRGEGTTYGGLCEYNRKAGVVHVTGAAWVCYNTISRYADNGFYAATAPLDDRTESILRCHGCISYGNNYNYRAFDARVLTFDCVSYDSNAVGYDASGSGVLIARNCKTSNETPKSGNVTVINDQQLT